MLIETTKQDIRDKLEAVGKAIPGFRSRPAQRLMIAEVAKTLARCPDAGQQAVASAPRPILCSQASTGTGKTLAYGLTGLIMAKLKGKKMVVSSSTIALQEQLVYRDLPMFITAAGMTASVALAKGRTRFVCQYRLLRSVADMQQVAMFSRETRAQESNAETVRMNIEEMAADLVSGKWDGDRDSRPGVTDDVWKNLTTDRHGCLNRNCPNFSTCAQMAARKKLKEADVIVTNHDMLLADLAMGGGVILPNPEDVFYMIDEAHSLPEKAVSSFASSHFVNAERRSCEKLAELAPTMSQLLGYGGKAYVERIEAEAMRLAELLADAGAFLGSIQQLVPTREAPRPTLEFQDSCVPEGFFTIGESIITISKGLVGLIDEVQDMVNEVMAADGSKKPIGEKVLADIGFYSGRLIEVKETWDLFLQEPPEDAPPVAKWIEAVTFKTTVDFQLNASPVVAGGYLKAMLWEKCAGAVLTSATMTTMGNFDDFLRRSGLQQQEVNCIELPSPFDYATQGTLTIPKMPSPKNVEAHTKALTERLISDMEAQQVEGMLVLFTSRRQMEDVFANMPPLLANRILVQGGQSKGEIIKAHRQRIDGGNPSVIFGLASFTEGVDLAHHYCTKVVVTKLPFSVPDSPVLSALSSWIEKRGGNPFMQISVPETARKLEQAVGRLIRTESDYGEVVVTDPRLWESKFGKSILKGLPPFRIIAMGREVTV